MEAQVTGKGENELFVRSIDRNFKTMEEAKLYQQQYFEAVERSVELEAGWVKLQEAKRKAYLKKHQIDFERGYHELVEFYNLKFDISQTDYDETPTIIVKINDETKLDDVIPKKVEKRILGIK